MARRRSSSSAMGPPPDRDVLMGPPPVPAPLSSSPPATHKSSTQEIHDKYRKLKRRFFELEEKHKETTSELQRSSERNVRMREERDHLLDRILELESQLRPNGAPTVPVSAPIPMAQPSSSAFPRTLLNARARTSFIANLREAIAEDDADDDVDPILASRHVGPEARRREEEERRGRERIEEEARETQSKKGVRKPRSSHGSTSSSHKGKETATSGSGHSQMTFSPTSHQASEVASPTRGSPGPLLVSSSGTKLRIKPPKASGSPPPDRLSPTSHQHAYSSSSSSRGHSHQRSPVSYTHPPPSHSHHSPHQPPQQRHVRRSVTPERDGHRPVSPGGGMEVDAKDDHAYTHRNHQHSPPLPGVNTESSYPRNDHHNENQGRDLPDPGHEDTRASSSTLPIRNEEAAPQSSSAPAPAEEVAPQRRSTRTRKSARVGARERSPAPPPAKRARTTSTRAEAKKAEAEAAAKAKAEAEKKRIEEERLSAEEEAKAKAEAEAIPQPGETVAPAEEEVLPQSRSPSPRAATPPATNDSPPSPIHDFNSPPSSPLSPPPPEDDVIMEDSSAPEPDSKPENAAGDVPENGEQSSEKERTPVPEPNEPSSAPAIDASSTTVVEEDVTMNDAPQSGIDDVPSSTENAKTHEAPLPTPPADVQAAASLPSPVSASGAAPPVPEVPAADSSTSIAASHETTPEMENIVKVAAAAIAAQNAANAASALQATEIPQPLQAPQPTPATLAQANANIDPNLDPSLAAESESQMRQKERSATPSSSTPASSAPVASSATSTTPQDSSNGTAEPSAATSNGSVPASNGSASGSPTPGTPSAASPSSVSTPSSLSGNPYLSLSTLIPKMPATGSPTSASTVGTPMGPVPVNPYSMYYPPGTPITPTTPGYPHPYNPYYYLAGPIPPGPSGMYPPSSPSYSPPASASRAPSDVQRHAKPKRLKAHTVTSKNYSIPMVPRDKQGKPMLPLNVGIMTVIRLGNVCMREHFHTERYIFPVGYEVTRRYLSTIDPNIEVVYHCTILDGGDGPKFQIVPADSPDRPVIAGTATGAWSSIVKQANAIRNRQHSNSVSGPDFFGLGQNTIKHLIQELPNANRLRDYVWQNFVEGGPLGGRHAAVIPALPEEYDASHPIGAYYPDRNKREPTPAAIPRGIHYYPQHIQAQARAAAAAAADQHAKQQSMSPPPPPVPGAQFHPPPPGAIPHLQQPSAGQMHVNVQPGSFPDYRPTPPHPTVDVSGSSGDARASPHASDMTPPPLVPATFASIMNAYPVPGTAPNPP